MGQFKKRWKILQNRNFKGESQKFLRKFGKTDY